MKCQKYKTKVYDSILDFVHENGHTITEIYIPEYNLAFNYHNNKLTVFDALAARSDSLSSPLVYIDLPINLIEKLVEINNIEKQSNLVKDNIKTDIEKIFKNT